MKALKRAFVFSWAPLKKGGVCGTFAIYVQPRQRDQYSEHAMSVSPFSNEEQTQEQAPLGAGQPVQASVTLPNLIRLAAINILVLTDLCVAMYMAAQNREEFTPVFFKVFFSLLVPILVLALVSKRFIRRWEKQ